MPERDRRRSDRCSTQWRCTKNDDRTGGSARRIRVLEIGNFMAGPFCAMQLADLGADVIKVENPDGGDAVRNTGPFLEGESSNFIRLNRNKRSLAIDLKHDTGKELFRNSPCAPTSWSRISARVRCARSAWTIPCSPHSIRA